MTTRWYPGDRYRTEPITADALIGKLVDAAAALDVIRDDLHSLMARAIASGIATDGNAPAPDGWGNDYHRWLLGVRMVDALDMVRRSTMHTRAAVNMAGDLTDCTCDTCTGN